MTPRKDLRFAKPLLSTLPAIWDGKKSILELKDANFNWRQMEWWGFYFEYLCFQKLKDTFSVPGDKFGKAKTACFDIKGSINWDLKAKAIKSDDHRSILNDTDVMMWSVRKYGAHGLIIALCDVEYNDNNRTFQKWHQKLKGGKSKYEINREKRTSVSRYRKTRAELLEILFLVVTPGNMTYLEIHRQGRNSNGKPRPPKYTGRGHELRFPFKRKAAKPQRFKGFPFASLRPGVKNFIRQKRNLYPCSVYMLDYETINKFLVDKIVF